LTSQELIKQLEKTTGRFQQILTKSIMQQINTFAAANIRGGLLNVRTGQLYREWQANKAESFDKGLKLQKGLPNKGEGTTSQYGAFLDDGGSTGGVIRAKNGKYLRIPLDAAKTKAGVDRAAGMIFKDNASLMNQFGFHWKGKGKVVTSAAGNPILFKLQFQRSKGGKWKQADEPWYVLKREVTIHPRYWLKEAIDAVDIETSINLAAKEAEA